MISFQEASNTSMKVFLVELLVVVFFFFILSSVINSSPQQQEHDDMIVLLFKFVFYVLGTIVDVISRVILTTTAYFIVLLIHAFKVPGEAAKGMIEQSADLIRSAMEYAAQLLIESINAVGSAVLDVIKDAIVEGFSASSSAMGELMETTKSSLQGLVSDIPEVANGISEMVTGMISDLWKNCMEAVGYIKENA
ncbi:hypothetical protein Nepgr_004313 [Nepenthes gracilis]|uniref:Uncharacterized protein n=1 Tax=Nepenthes gracilis TaxID=150966 RepID=A0AAD3XEX7_NEPGR|nr:hypothetical protein Nepgr_004313 [Nepenthes gracilis]